MYKNIFLSIIVCLVSAYIGLSAYAIANQNIEQLLVCADKGGMKIPLSKYLCKKYLLTFRGTSKDIDVLQHGIGALFVVEGESTASQRNTILRHLVSSGLDVNAIDKNQLRPLHGAVLNGSVVEVELLLRNGANPFLKDERFDFTPLELAIYIKNKNRLPGEYAEIISILEKAEKERLPHESG